MKHTTPIVLSQKDADRFWSKADVGTDEECWLWQGTKTRAGYGHIAVNHTQLYAHRISYVLCGGHIPDGALICHRCNTPACCNPSHVYVGSDATNIQDKKRAGTTIHLHPPQGTACYQAKLTEEQVREIRQSYRYNTPGFSIPALAKQYSVDKNAIWLILHQRTYKNVL